MIEHIIKEFSLAFVSNLYATLVTKKYKWYSPKYSKLQNIWQFWIWLESVDNESVHGSCSHDTSSYTTCFIKTFSRMWPVEKIGALQSNICRCTLVHNKIQEVQILHFPAGIGQTILHYWEKSSTIKLTCTVCQ